MPGRTKAPVLLLFAKTPIAGQVKTRLMPELCPQQAAEVASRLIRLTVDLAVNSWPGRVELKVWPDCHHPVFEHITREYGLEMSLQGPGDLGEKMLSSLQPGTGKFSARAVMGCDVPQCPPQYLRDTYKLLDQDKANVIGPSADGGYYLIGLQRAYPNLFLGIEWGGPSVLSSTMQKAQESGVQLTQLPVLRDIDCYQDLITICKYYPHIDLYFDFINK